MERVFAFMNKLELQACSFTILSAEFDAIFVHLSQSILEFVDDVPKFRRRTWQWIATLTIVEPLEQVIEFPRLCLTFNCKTVSKFVQSWPQNSVDVVSGLCTIFNDCLDFFRQFKIGRLIKFCLSWIVYIYF